MDLKLFLEDLLGRKVDLVLSDDIKPRLKEKILAEVIDAA
jgi:predicted nucleotidyltransferase